MQHSLFFIITLDVDIFTDKKEIEVLKKLEAKEK